MKTYILLLLVLSVVMISSCSKNGSPSPNLDGSYTGRVIANQDHSVVGNVNVQLSGKNYQSAFTGSLSYMSRGTFTINNNNVIFTDSLAHTANFNWGILLSGTYTPTFNGDSLFLVRTDGSYAYRLKKQ
jgi:hypothetical protein